jgi:hypothetical protein
LGGKAHRLDARIFAHFHVSCTQGLLDDREILVLGKGVERQPQAKAIRE